jgi:hypothetical protein
LFDNAQPESADISGVVRVGTSEIFVAEIRHFAIKKKSQATWSRELFGKVLKNLSHFEEEEIYEISKKKSEGFGQISSFLLLKSPYLVNRFCCVANM